MEDCRRELAALLQEEVGSLVLWKFCLVADHVLGVAQRLAGASLLVFANKQDIAGGLSTEEIAQVSVNISS